MREKNLNPRQGKIALLDFGLIARVDSNSRDLFINAIIHLANRDYFSLADDFVDLKILPPPPETNVSIVVPLMERTLTPYVAGGGATKYRDEISKVLDKLSVGLVAQFPWPGPNGLSLESVENCHCHLHRSTVMQADSAL